MPSPVGHALGAIAVSQLVARPAATRWGVLLQTALAAGFGTAPDLDLLIGRHSRETHSIGAAAIAATIAALVRLPFERTRGRIWLVAFCAWMTHPLLDMLTSDTSLPFGVMFLWPFSTEHVQSGITVFNGISRYYRADDFWSNNLQAMTRELLILVPFTAMCWWLRRYGRSEEPAAP